MHSHDDGIVYYGLAAAFLDDQVTWLGDWSQRQYITLELADDGAQHDPALCPLTSSEARDLAFRLLTLAEHADRRANGDEDLA